MALLFTVLCGAAVLILAYFSYYFYRGHFVHGTEAVIETEIRNAALWDLRGEVAPALDGNGRAWLLIDPEGHKLAGNLDRLPASVSLLAEGTILFDMAFEGQARKFAARIHTFADGRRLMVGIDITEVAAAHRFMQWLGIVSIVLMIAVIVTSYLISRFVVVHTGRIAATAETIMATGDLSQRIPVGNRWDDLSHMAAVLNAFLDRIEHLMQGIRHVSDNIAHDLRTPLTRMRGNLETLARHRAFADDPDLSEAGRKLIEEADGLLGTFSALLRISRLEAGRELGERSSIDMRAMVADALELYEPLAEEKSVALSADLAPVEYYGDRDLLFQAVANVIDNAVKFTPPGGRIAVELAAGGEGKGVVLSVADNGPGVAAQERSRIFARFYRAEQSRSTQGSGLGLSLVAAAVSLHGGTVDLYDNNPGLKVVLKL